MKPSASKLRCEILDLYDSYGIDVLNEMVFRMDIDELREFVDHFKRNWNIEDEMEE